MARSKLARSADAAMLVASLALLGLAARSQLVSSPGETVRPDTPVSSELWRDLIGPGQAAEGMQSASADSAQVTIVIFADYECPTCKRFWEGPIHTLREEMGERLQVVHRHWPLSYHPGAYAAAVAAECAGRQERFDAMSTELYAVQPTLSRRSDYWELAARAGVVDSLQFAQCIADGTVVGRMVEDSLLRLRLPAKPFGTPTVLVQGKLLGRVPGWERLRELLYLDS